MFFEGERVIIYGDPEKIYTFDCFLADEKHVRVIAPPLKDFPLYKEYETVSIHEVVSVENKLEIARLTADMQLLRAELEELKKSRNG